MSKAYEILWHIEELYGKEPNLAAFEGFIANAPEKVGMWEKAFEKYDLSDVLQSIDEYWRFKNDKTRPTVAKLLAMLDAVKAPKETSNIDRQDYGTTVAPAEQAMQRDSELGRCRHLLPIYKQAVDYILCDLLAKEMPASVWQKLNFSQRYKQALDKGLMDKLDEALCIVCKKITGKEYQFESANMLKELASNREYSVAGSVNTLGAHWRVK